MTGGIRVTVRFKRLREGAMLPAYQTAHAAGMDLAACPEQSVRIEPGQIALVPCGFAMALPVGYEAQVRPRSGLASRHGITLPNAPGTIDADYRGEVSVPLINHGREAFVVEPGMRVAQMVIAPVAQACVSEVEDLDGPVGLGLGSRLGSGVEMRPFPPPTPGAGAGSKPAGAVPESRAGSGTPSGGGSPRIRGVGGFGSTGV